jgi:hypothetical protein
MRRENTLALFGPWHKFVFAVRLSDPLIICTGKIRILKPAGLLRGSVKKIVYKNSKWAGVLEEKTMTRVGIQVKLGICMT